MNLHRVEATLNISFAMFALKKTKTGFSLNGYLRHKRLLKLIAAAYNTHIPIFFLYESMFGWFGRISMGKILRFN